jgi:hypothetical protein
MFRFRPLPFARETELALGPEGRLYAGYEDSLRVVAHGLDGRTDVIADVPTPPGPLSEAERDSALAPIENPAMRQAVAAALPDTRPAFTNLIVSDEGRLWVRRPPDGTAAERTAWWILNPETNTIHQVRLPREVELTVVQNGKAYGKTTTEMGAPAVVRYHIDTNA